MYTSPSSEWVYFSPFGGSTFTYKPSWEEVPDGTEQKPYEIHAGDNQAGAFDGITAGQKIKIYSYDKSTHATYQDAKTQGARTNLGNFIVKSINGSLL